MLVIFVHTDYSGYLIFLKSNYITDFHVDYSHDVKFIWI